jgi:hypothetical protein
LSQTLIITMKVLLNSLILALMNAQVATAQFTQEPQKFSQNNFDAQSTQNQSIGNIYLDCQFGQGKWISLTIQPGSNLAMGQINDGSPMLYTALHEAESVVLTPRQPGKKLTINLQTYIITREWYLKSAAGSAGTGECENSIKENNSFIDNAF